MASNNFFNRLKSEINYYRMKNWSFKDVGDFWDTIEEYDDINSGIYPYRQRFINSKKMFDKLNLINFDPINILDIQCRTGNGSIFWSKFYKNMRIYGYDFSENFLKKSQINFKNHNLKFETKLIEHLPLPNENNYFDLILCYETIEHVCNYGEFISELARVLKPNGYLIITCPNVSWEFNHFFSTVIGINHSEGPHKFIPLKNIKKEINNNGLKILSYNTSIFFPFNNRLSIILDRFMNNYMPKFLKKLLFLRHSFVITKN